MRHLVALLAGLLVTVPAYPWAILDLSNQDASAGPTDALAQGPSLLVVEIRAGGAK